jgi:hypothetical protein
MTRDCAYSPRTRGVDADSNIASFATFKFLLPTIELFFPQPEQCLLLPILHDRILALGRLGRPRRLTRRVVTVLGAPVRIVGAAMPDSGTPECKPQE